ncbi:MAG: trans-aconitate 2-methyltransferase [Arthrobacter sp.]|uniref:trans-aconitate 2-methyltransferase n=1 Tax=unclassified Arthrobacter TaxID=235627 RepID=UPI002650ADCF|nr:trans-aconitate 2-methyltransferase [Micrococcaceae bacterium]MDN5823850.1 trans-aconitate 2-methyltransferase [Micrococcaceae bacterium]MDN6300263.1 trans-aconitate 2-methyltransferase [Micrococcaceae bacterium]
MKWNPAKYVQFATHRDRPFFELIARIEEDAPRRVVDLGCGPGPLTAALADRWPDARITGLDASPEMIGKATADHQRPRVDFAEADAATWTPEAETDVLISNAMMQWIPGHGELMAGWLDALKPGAWFAAQVPGNFEAPSHALMRGLAAEAQWADRLQGLVLRKDAVAEPETYLRLMFDHGFEADVWETTYEQILHGPDPVLDWVRGTALRPILSVLEDADAAEFEAEYAALVREAYPPFTGPDGGELTVFPFRRIFMVGRKEDRR